MPALEDKDIIEHQKGSFHWDQGAINWMRSRPDSIKALMRRFPPSCIVMAHPQLSIHLPPDDVAILRSYVEPNPDHPHGGITVRKGAHAESKSYPLSRFTVVGYWKDMNEDMVNDILDYKLPEDSTPVDMKLLEQAKTALSQFIDK